MSTYNTLRVTIPCPRCGHVEEVEVAAHFGETTQMRSLSVGDRYPWVPRKEPQHGGRPPEGSTDGEGYMECERCHKDSFLRIVVQKDVIVEVQPDAMKATHIK